LIVTNGAYGERIVKMAKYIGLNFVQYSIAYDELPKEEELRDMIMKPLKLAHSSHKVYSHLVLTF